MQTTRRQVAPPAGSGNPRLRSGAALLIALILMTAVMIIIGAVIYGAQQESYMTRQALEYQRACVVAESGLDYATMILRNLLVNYQLSTNVLVATLQNTLNQVNPPPPPPGPYDFLTPSKAAAFSITVDSPVMAGTITSGVTAAGCYGGFQYFTITCGAINTNTFKSGAVLRKRLQALSLSEVRYGIFYQDDLEILPGGTMTFYGKTHCNSDMYIGGPLSFYDRITCAGNLYCQRKDDPSQRPGTALIINSHSALVTTATSDGFTFMDCNDPNWMTQSLLLWNGNCLSAVHGISDLSPPIDPLSTAHDMIERPLATNALGYAASTEAAKFANQAAVYIMVASNGALTVTDSLSNNITSTFTNFAKLKITGTNATTHKPIYGKDAASNYTFTNAGIIGISTQAFFDAREQSFMSPVDIYVDQLMLNFSKLYDGTYTPDQGQGIVYVTRDPLSGANSGSPPCIRLRNCSNILPNLGLTVASDLPLYVEGNCNSSNDKPMMVVADAVTFLSKNWQDANSAQGGGTESAQQKARPAVNTTYNLVVMSGNYPTVVGTYNGGLENELRFLEDWSSSTVTYRGSVIDLWASEKAKGMWGNPDAPSDLTTNHVIFIYNVPATRNYGYDPIYARQNPPGTSQLFGLEVLKWERWTFKDVGW